jgi:hypothetical protein
MSRDWHAWHVEYDDPTSSLSRRLEVVREQLRAVLASYPEARRLVSLCAGDGRDVLPVLAASRPDLEAVLVELDPALATRARQTAADLGLDRVDVRQDDAGATDAYRGGVPADVLMACGVFGNISDDDVDRTIGTLPTLLRDQGTVVWTRGGKSPGDPARPAADPSERVRRVFAASGFEEIAFVRPEDADYRVGVHRLAAPSAGYVPGVQMFTFV